MAGAFKPLFERATVSLRMIGLSGLSEADAAAQLEQAIRHRQIGVHFVRREPTTEERQTIDWSSVDVFASTIRFRPVDVHAWQCLPGGAGIPEAFEVSVEDRERLWPATSGRGKPGRKASADWNAITEALRIEIGRAGMPDPEGSQGWRAQADVERWVADLLDTRAEQASESTVRSHVVEMLAAIKAGN